MPPPTPLTVNEAFHLMSFRSLGNTPRASPLASLFGSAAPSRIGDADMSPVTRYTSFIIDVEAGQRKGVAVDDNARVV